MTEALLFLFFVAFFVYGLMLVFNSNIFWRWDVELREKNRGNPIPERTPQSEMATKITGIIMALGSAIMLFLLITQG